MINKNRIQKKKQKKKLTSNYMTSKICLIKVHNAQIPSYPNEFSRMGRDGTNSNNLLIKIDMFALHLTLELIK